MPDSRGCSRTPPPEYGYRPGRAALWLAGLITAGTIAFGLHHPTPAKSSGNPEFNPFFYTLDLLLPVVNYGQHSAFNPTGLPVAQLRPHHRTVAPRHHDHHRAKPSAPRN